MGFIVSSHAQTINWEKINTSNNHLINLNVGLEYGAVLELRYAYLLNPERRLLLNASASIPLGEEILDDYKITAGVQQPVFQIGHLNWSYSLDANFRSNNLYYVHMKSIGLEGNTIMGYYREKSHIGIEIGYDSALLTRMNHTDSYIMQFPKVTNGWFLNAGANWHYGVQGSYSLLDSNELNIKIGLLTGLGRKENPLIPYYLKLGWNYHF